MRKKDTEKRDERRRWITQRKKNMTKLRKKEHRRKKEQRHRDKKQMWGWKTDTEKEILLVYIIRARTAFLVAAEAWLGSIWSAEVSRNFSSGNIQYIIITYVSVGNEA
jgi:hypothetical protein